MPKTLKSVRSEKIGRKDIGLWIKDQGSGVLIRDFLMGAEKQKPEWMRTTPPPETVAATRVDGERVALYDYDPGEKIAAPFAEQIEDILRAHLSADPALAAMDVDLGTAPDGGLEIWVDGECYTDVSLLPDERLRQAFRQAIERWEQTQE